MDDIQVRLAKYKDRKEESRYFKTLFYNYGLSFGHPNGGRTPDRGEFTTWVEPSLRFVGNADSLARIGHRGWYIDLSQRDVAYGQVYRLSARNGEERFLAAYVYSYDTDCVTFDITEVFDDKREAALAADEMARIAAEHSREADQEDEINQQKEEARERRSALRVRMRSIMAALRWKRRMARTSPPVYIPDIFNTLAEEELRRSIAERAELYKIWKYGPEDS
ncbi:hypothetical protein PAER4900a_00041 [Pseudomonas phage YMC17/07/R4900a]|nr:hypothetical protein PAER4900a_00041 [Pseudomonas phage YMC17/07/R4900a]